MLPCVGNFTDKRGYMFEHSRSFAIGQMYREELLRVKQDPALIDNVEASVLMTQFDSMSADAIGVFHARSLNGDSKIKAHLLSKEEAEAMVDAQFSAVYIVGLRERRYADFMALLSSQKCETVDIMRQRIAISYRSREWGIWLRQLRKYARLRIVLTKLRGRAIAYSCGLRTDPTENLESLAGLFRSRKATDF